MEPRGGVILNINGDAAARGAVSRILRGDGFEVHEAATGAEALAHARALTPSLIVLDVPLPDAADVDVRRRLKDTPDGEEVPLLQTSAPLAAGEDDAEDVEPHADGYLTRPVEPLELLATVRALLRASAAERDLRGAEAEWRQTFDGMAEGVALASPEGVVTRANEAMRQFVGNAVLDGMRLDALLGRLADGNGAALLNRVRRRGRRASKVVHAGGRWLDVSLQPIAAGHEAPGRLLTVVSDVTAQRTLVEQERRRTKELADENTSKDRFLAMLAHELRNPLNAIATANALSGRIAADDRQRDIHDTIARHTGHLTRLVDDLLEVSRLTRGRLQLQLQHLDLAQTLRHAIDTTRALVDARGHRLRVRLPDEAVPVRADALRLEQVFVNVIDNAVKYSEPGSAIAITCTVEGEHATVRVQDRGLGIEPQHLEAIFEPFVQIDASLARTLGGVGVGLSLARGLVDQHGGSIRAESAGIGHGTAIIVTLPVASSAMAPRPTSERDRHAHASDGRLTVLIVDDNADAVDMLRTLLETHAHTVHVAYDGRSGLQAALSIRPDLALVDIGLPGIDGYDVAVGVRASAAARDMCLVAVTGYGRPEDGARALEAGFDYRLVKPVDFDELEHLLDSVASRVSGEARARRRVARPERQS